MAFLKYYAFSAAGKVVSLYVIPSLLLRLTYYDTVSFTYWEVAIVLMLICNGMGQLLFSTKFKCKVPGSIDRVSGRAFGKEAGTGLLHRVADLHLRVWCIGRSRIAVSPTCMSA